MNVKGYFEFCAGNFCLRVRNREKKPPEISGGIGML